MKTQYKDKDGRKIGYTETSATGVVTARRQSGSKIGYYNPKTDKTYRGNTVVGSGNLVTNFFTEL